MPIVNVEQFPLDTKILIWQVTEEIDFFISKIGHQYPDSPWRHFNPKRQMEYLVSRYLIQLGLPHQHFISELKKDSCGCPHFPTYDIHCGISHSSSYIAAITSSEKVGCDIEIYQPEKILRIAPRIIGKAEESWVRGEDISLKTQLVWGIKESAYKTWGKKNIDWLRDIDIDPILWHPQSGDFTGSIGSLNCDKLYFYGEYTYHKDFLFVWTKERKNIHANSL
ncbi:4'-phosphopantetheinyl transferase family protein [Membranihabitans marinus]|uniref:4'-phosphopantetheinyl transferase family protein n=1 Tax=Membranihabitans marinus TaxID=1227546 RepID=UPI001F02F388|nr:4'-phosphopantetheinyl transferase superfamily protein [Membranihabitans marinus]